jgi:hypothetical protein
MQTQAPSPIAVPPGEALNSGDETVWRKLSSHQKRRLSTVQQRTGHRHRKMRHALRKSELQLPIRVFMGLESVHALTHETAAPQGHEGRGERAPRKTARTLA